MTDIDFSNPAAVRAEAERRQRLRAQGYTTFGGTMIAPLATESAPYVEIVGGELTSSIRVIGREPFSPIRLRLPWTALCSDNERERASLVIGKAGRPTPRKLMTARYKAARAKVVAEARAAMAGRAALAMPLALVARVYTPTQRRSDIVNFAKGVHDALNRIVYVDDLWLRDVRWVDAGMDADAPRAEIEIRPL